MVSTATDIHITEAAARHLEQLRSEAGLSPDYGIRVSVTGGGCSGLSYSLDFDNEEQPGDQVFADHGVRIFVSLKSYLYLAGTELDFTGGLKGKGFHFNNPNAARTCGCGESFGV